MGQHLIEAIAGGFFAEAAATEIGISARSVFEWQKLHSELDTSINLTRIIHQV